MFVDSKINNKSQNTRIDVKSNAHQEVLLSTNLTYNKGELHGLKISASLIMLSNQGVETK